MQPGNRERAPYRVARRARNAAVAGGSGQARNALSVGHGLVQLLLELGLCLFRLLPQLQGTRSHTSFRQRYVSSEPARLGSLAGSAAKIGKCW
jgi:hypothetical protein